VCVYLLNSVGEPCNMALAQLQRERRNTYPRIINQ